MTRTPERIFITGGAGFIGARLTAASVAAGAEVTVYDSFLPQVHDGNPDGRAIVAKSGAKIVVGDIRDPDALNTAIATARPDTVYHLAAETGTGQSYDEPVRYSAVNVLGTAHLVAAIRASRSVRRLILAGSRSVYGEGACIDADGQNAQAMPRRAVDLAAGDFAPKNAFGWALTPVPTAAATCATNPASVYASTKLMQEYLLTQAFWGSDVDVGILRLQNVFGAGQSLHNPYTGVLSIFVSQIAAGCALEIFEDGAITRDFIEVGDVVRAFSAMARVAEMPMAPVDIGSGSGVTILQIARKILALMGAVGSDARDARIRISGAFRPGDIRHAVADPTVARRTLNWSATESLENGLQNLIAMASRAVQH